MRDEMKARGFTLVELIIVVVLLGITAVTITFFFTGSVRGYLDTANRQDSAAVARIALDRIARELREAMPQSVRVLADGSCLQFLPIHSSFVYTSLASGNVTVQAIEPPGGVTDPGAGFFAAVYPLHADELYGMQAMRSVAFGAVNANIRTLTLNPAFAAPHPRAAPGERLFVVGDPVSFCFSGGQLNRFVSAVNATQPAPGAGLINGALLADKINVAQSSFSYGVGNWQNNALVTINLTVEQAGSNNERLLLTHEVWLRNVQ